MAHALVMQVTLQGTGEEAQQMLKDVVVPMAKSQAGFQAGTWMHDGSNGMGVIVFATADQAEAAKGALKPPAGGPSLVSSTVYEVAAQA